MEAEALCSAGGGDPAGAVGRVLGPRLAPSPARAQRSLDGPQNQPAAVSGANIALTGGQASRGITASGSWRRESRRNCTGQVPGPRTWGQTDQRRALFVGASLCPSHHRPRGRGRGGSRERRDSGSPPPRPSDRRRGSDHLVAQTNPPVRGRVSADRSEEAAQPLTTPRLVRKSSTDDSVRLHCMWGLRAFGRCDAGFPRRRRVPLAWAEKGRLEAVP